jgi:tripartite-type tricarboxylate transporter receptor subunit TctC
MSSYLRNAGRRQRLSSALTRRRFLVSATATAAALGTASRAGAAGDYSGKTITMVVGFPPGGGVDTGARLIARHLPRFIDGSPNIVVQNMPGAGGVVAANYLYTKAPRDGLTVGVPGRDWPLVPVLFQKGARYEPLEFDYIGSTGEVNTFVWLRKSLGITTPEQLKAGKKEIVFGGLTPSTQPSMIPKILALNGFPVKAVSGYRGTAAIINAIEKGEVDAIATNAASFARRPHMMDMVVRVFQLLPSSEKIPLAEAFVADESKKLLALTGYASATGMPLVAPPKTDAARVATLTAAFDKMTRDKAFEADANKIGEPHGSPISGSRIREILKQTMTAATPAVLAKFRELATR